MLLESALGLCTFLECLCHIYCTLRQVAFASIPRAPHTVVCLPKTGLVCSVHAKPAPSSRLSLTWVSDSFWSQPAVRHSLARGGVEWEGGFLSPHPCWPCDMLQPSWGTPFLQLQPVGQVLCSLFCHAKRQRRVDGTGAPLPWESLTQHPDAPASKLGEGTGGRTA